jgi:hypothetical protein
MKQGFINKILSLEKIYNLVRAYRLKCTEQCAMMKSQDFGGVRNGRNNQCNDKARQRG